MKKALLIFVTFITVSCFAQNDTIFKMNGDLLPVNVKEITESSIKYSYPGEDLLNTITKSTVLKIHFKSGRVQEFSTVMNILNVKSCLDWKNVQISTIESEVVGLMKIDNLGAKAEGMTTMSSISKLQDRVYNKVKMGSAMIGGNIFYIIEQNTEAAISGGEYGSTKMPNVSISGICYTSKKVFQREISYGNYSIDMVYVLHTNAYEIEQASNKPESFEISQEDIYMENNFPRIKLYSKNIKNVQVYTIIFASSNELILSGIKINKKGKKTYYNLFLKK